MSKNEAKELAFFFFEEFNINYNKSMIGKTLVQARKLLETYELEELKEVIRLIKAKGKYPYSFGYINTVVDSYIVKARANIKKANYKPETIEFISDNKKPISSYELPKWVDDDMFK